MPEIPRSPFGRVNPYGAPLISSGSRRGEGITRSFGRIAQNLGAVGYHEMRREYREAEHDAAAILAIESDAIGDWHRASHETEDGFLRRKGWNASGVTDEGREFYLKLLDKSFARAENETQRHAVQRLMESHWRAWQSDLRTHEEREGERFLQSSATARIDVAKRDAIYNWANPEAIGRNEQAIAVAVRSKSTGLAPEFVVSQIALQRGQMYVGAIEAALNAGALDRARELLEQGRSTTAGGKKIASIDPAVVSQLQQAIEGGKESQDATLRIQEIRSLGLSKTEELEKAQEIEDPFLRRKVVNGIRKAQLQDATDEKWARIRQDEEQWQIFSQVPDQDLALVPPHFDEKQRSLATKAAMARVSGKTITTDAQARAQLERMIVENPEKFKETHIALEFATKLSPRDRAHYIGLQSEMRGHGAEDKVLRIASVDRQIQRFKVDMGIATGTDEETVEKRRKAEQYFYTEILRAGYTTANVPQEELDRIKATAALEGELWSGHSYWSDPAARYYETAGSRGERERFYYSDIPASVKDQIEKEIVREGAVLDWPEVNRRYISGIRSGRWEEGEEFREGPETEDSWINLPTYNPPVVNPDGSVSNVRLSSFTFDMDDGQRTFALPTMIGGRQLTPQEAVAVAKRIGLEKFPSFETVDEAEEWIARNHGRILP